MTVTVIFVPTFTGLRTSARSDTYPRVTFEVVSALREQPRGQRAVTVAPFGIRTRSRVKRVLRTPVAPFHDSDADRRGSGGSGVGAGVGAGAGSAAATPVP